MPNRIARVRARKAPTAPAEPRAGRPPIAGTLRGRVGGDSAQDLLDDALGMLASLFADLRGHPPALSPALIDAATPADRIAAIYSVLAELRREAPPPIERHPEYRRTRRA